MHRKRHTKVSGKKKTQRGGYYSAAGPIPGTVGAMQWSRHTEVPVVAGGRRKRKSKKVTRRRKMRGGNKYGGVSASYQGQGVAGLANYSAVTSRGPPGVAALGKFNDFGAGPGSKFGI